MLYIILFLISIAVKAVLNGWLDRVMTLITLIHILNLQKILIL